jgi:Baseplate J-like protein
MPLQLPVLDDRNFEQLLEEARRRIPIYTPEWTNFAVESDPGITIVQLFAFLTESLLYRANRIPDRNRLKFLQLLGISLQPAAPADGLIAIHNERGPMAPLPLERGVVVSAGNVDFLTRDPVNVLPVEAQVYYKRKILKTDPRYTEFQAKYDAILAAMLAEEAGTAAELSAATGAPVATSVELDFYETMRMPAPTPSDPNPVVDLHETSDRAVYIALLAPSNVHVDDARAAIANQTLSIGVVPAMIGDVPPLRPLRPAGRRAPIPNLIYDIPDVQPGVPVARYTRLRVLQQPDVLTATGIVQVELRGASQLQTWSFPEPLQEGTDDFPPRLEDEEIRKRLVTWIRMSLPAPDRAEGAAATAEASGREGRLTWVGINAVRVTQAVPVVNELLGKGTGEPDQMATLANTPVLRASVNLVVENDQGIGQPWRLVDDLLAAGPDDQVFTLDAESGQVRFGDGLRGVRPPFDRRILVSYEYGGGPQGNVGIGAIKAGRDGRLQGGYSIENPVPTSGGSLGQSVAEGERDIPLVLRHRDRLVTLQDFEDVARRTPGVDVGRVEVLPLFLPSNPQDAGPGVVTVLVIPNFDALGPLWPSPDRLFLRRVCEHLDPRRLVTTEIYVRGPTYVPVYVSVGIQVRGGFFPDVVRQEVEKRLQGYLSALPPGGPEGKGWPLNKRLMRKDLEAVVTRVPGVEFVNTLELGVKTPVDVPEYDMTGLELPMLVASSVREGTAEPVASIVSTPVSTDPSRIKVVHVPVTKTKC